MMKHNPWASDKIIRVFALLCAAAFLSLIFLPASTFRSYSMVALFIIGLAYSLIPWELLRDSTNMTPISKIRQAVGQGLVSIVVIGIICSIIVLLSSIFFRLPNATGALGRELSFVILLLPAAQLGLGFITYWFRSRSEPWSPKEIYLVGLIFSTLLFSFIAILWVKQAFFTLPK